MTPAKHVVITGISQGIGRQTAYELVRAGCHVYGNVRREKDIDPLLADLSVTERERLVVAACDLSSREQIERWIVQSLDRVPVDALINNAGTGRLTAFEEVSLAEWDDLLQVNLTSSFRLAQWAFASMKRRQTGGLILQIGSLASIPGMEKFPGFAAYTASKYAAAGLSEQIAYEGKSYQIRSLCLSPGAVDTRLRQRMAPHLKERLMQPEEIARMIKELVLNQHLPLNGVNLPVYKW
ncbi:SDR family oxidoreductase [Brevibacillus humidisoli]|uniref:SDR family oxidoreductase n=1 Tax=Brevibacillus humidisoli TaxID=2895522 RepID=UPI001E37938E|nr:SDR family oxidoreductase [Brevibacillus humidisoli]UFJ42469.1 SDR family oxidoreductase [Brevibacillus humidisoli]